MKRLLPVLIAIFGLAAGVGAGLLVKPSGLPAAGPTAAGDQAGEDGISDAAADDADREFVRLSSQFIVPVVADERIDSMVILTLSLDVSQGGRVAVHTHEPKLRAALLQVLFDHANAGGFTGNFTESGRLRHLRQALGEAAERVLDGVNTEVLILDIIRQDS